MAEQFDGVVILGAHSITTTGSYIASWVTDRLTPIHDYFLLPLRLSSLYAGSSWCCQLSVWFPQHRAEWASYGTHSNQPLLGDVLMVSRRPDGRNHHCRLVTPRRRAVVLSAHCRYDRKAVLGHWGFWELIYLWLLESMTKEECLEFTANDINLVIEWVVPVEGWFAWKPLQN